MVHVVTGEVTFDFPVGDCEMEMSVCTSQRASDDASQDCGRIPSIPFLDQQYRCPRFQKTAESVSGCFCMSDAAAVCRQN